MGNLHDHAVAKAEARLIKQWTKYRFDEEKDFKVPTTPDYDGLLWPIWIEFATQYTHTVVKAFAREILDPTAMDDPHERVALLKLYLQKIPRDLFSGSNDFFFYAARTWNERPEEERDDEDQIEITAEIFHSTVLNHHRTSIREGIMEWTIRAIASFWQKRAAVTRATVQCSPELKAASPKAKRLLRETPAFPQRAVWLKEHLRDRGWNIHDLQRAGGPDRKTIQKILDGKFVREDGLEKVVNGLNHTPKGALVKMRDVPDS